MKTFTDTKRKSSTSTIKQAIEALLDAYKIRGKFNETNITASWERIMGVAVANRTSELYIKNGTLFVKLTSAVLKNELSMSKTKILANFEQDCGEKMIDHIIFL